jgi:hypothetical protein
MLSPVLAIEAGYNMYLTANGDRGTQIYKSAAAAVDQFEALLSKFPQDTKEGIYCLYLRLAANSLAKGIGRRKEELRKQKKAAEDELEQMIEEKADSEKAVGRIKTIWNALLAGGVVWFILQVIFGVQIDQGGHGRQNISLGIAIAFTLVANEFRGWISGRTKKKLFAVYKKANEEADEQYSKAAGEEYAMAAGLVELGWREMINSDPPVTGAFNNLLKRAVTNASLNETPKTQLLEAA